MQNPRNLLLKLWKSQQEQGAMDTNETHKNIEEGAFVSACEANAALWLNKVRLLGKAIKMAQSRICIRKRTAAVCIALTADKWQLKNGPRS